MTINVAMHVYGARDQNIGFFRVGRRSAHAWLRGAPDVERGIARESGVPLNWSV